MKWYVLIEIQYIMFQVNFGVCLVFLFFINSEVCRMTFMTTNGIFLLLTSGLLLIAAQNKDVLHFHVAMTSFSSDNNKIQTV